MSILLIFVVIIVLVCVILALANNKTDAGQETWSLEELLQQYHVPENYHKAVLYSACLYDLYYTPVIMWKMEDGIKLLVVNQNPHIIESPIEEFRTVNKDIVAKGDLLYKPGYWYALPSYIKNEFSGYVNFYDIKPRHILDEKNFPYRFGRFEFCQDSLISVFETLNMPLDFYKISFTDKEYLMNKMPRENIDSYKERIIAQIFESKDYMKIQEELYALQWDKVLTESEVLAYLEKARKLG